MKRATYRLVVIRGIIYFNPRPREEGDKTRPERAFTTTHFNPRPREEGDKMTTGERLFYENFNPRPREEGDYKIYQNPHDEQYFNPRPREEGDTIFILPFCGALGFQSTPS